MWTLWKSNNNVYSFREPRNRIHVQYSKTQLPNDRMPSFRLFIIFSRVVMLTLYYVNELWSEARKLIYAIESKPMNRKKIDTCAGLAWKQYQLVQLATGKWIYI